LLYFSKGQVYTFEGRRTKEDLIAYAQGGYKKAEATKVPGPVGFFAEFTSVFENAYKQAMIDISKGKYFSPDVIILLSPFFFILTIILILSMSPAHQYETKKSLAEAAKKKD
jgi:hypothetical protein